MWDWLSNLFGSSGSSDDPGALMMGDSFGSSGIGDLNLDAFSFDLPGIDLGALLALDSFGPLPDITSYLQGPGMFTDPVTGATREWTPQELEYMQTGQTMFDTGNGGQVYYNPYGVATYDNINDPNARVHTTSMDGANQAWYQNGNAAIYQGIDGQGGYDRIMTGTQQGNGVTRQDTYTPGGGQQTTTSGGSGSGNAVKDFLNGNSGLNKLGLAALASYLLNKADKGSGSSGGWTPPTNLSYNREQKAQDPARRPGSANPGGYFGDVTYRAQGGLLQGPGDGLSDSIPAQIDGETQSGARRLQEMLSRVRQEAHGHDKQIRPVSDKTLPR